MPSDKHNSITAKAMGLIFALFDDVHFRQLLQLQHLPHGYTEVLLCSPLYSIPFFTALQVMICCMRSMALVRDFGNCSASRGAL